MDFLFGDVHVASAKKKRQIRSRQDNGAAGLNPRLPSPGRSACAQGKTGSSKLARESATAGGRWSAATGRLQAPFQAEEQHHLLGPPPASVAGTKL
ncbi:hypothetical protein KL930_002435 [Ogataea haglerorum]|nr:hypothetical protein KL932_003961 [Ogataea haglerorum]KAG7759461.1 hypothetical protein KL947_001842 [Ogataea haglerorum]KAG7778348.1 hypothetical protein KL930_002435 [Ogataea haglerorum]KAG7779034.1 hypothetical protein KL922_001519 [Ogataea haglerorum]KAG7811208.1 hypothetical protein KL924_001874 [Ogataea haglerorum]